MSTDFRIELFSTAVHAADLIATYARRGYVIVDHTQWPDVNYRSVIMSKRL